MTNGIYTILLLILSNVFMTFAWYGHLRLQQSGISTNWPLYLVIAFSWVIAFFEYCCQVPANRIGFVDNGGPFSLVQLKVIQECISLVVFAIIANFIFQHEELHWNHAAAALCLVAASAGSPVETLYDISISHYDYFTFSQKMPQTSKPHY